MQGLKPGYLAVAFCIFVYITFRAVYVDATYDEVWTLTVFVPCDVINIINGTPCDANNHILNTLLIKLFSSIGGTSLFVARLPTILAAIVYLLFSYRICDKLVGGLTGFCIFLLLILNPFLLDFFSIARGYGLSLALEVISLYYFLLFLQHRIQWQAVVAIVAGAFAVTANLNLTNYWLPVILLINLAPVISTGKPNMKLVSYSFIITLAFVLTVYEQVRKLIENGNLYYGGTDLYNDTFLSLVRYTLYTTDHPIHAEYILIVLSILFFAILALSFRMTRFDLVSGRNMLLCLLLLILIALVTQHLLFGTLYPINRTALYLYPIIIILSGYAIKDIPQRLIGYTAMISVMIPFLCNFAVHANSYKTVSWSFDAHTRTILKKINDLGKDNNRKIKIRYSWPFRSVIIYYYGQGKYPFIELPDCPSCIDDKISGDVYIYLGKCLDKIDYNAYAQQARSLGYKNTFLYFEEENVRVYLIDPVLKGSRMIAGH